MADLVSARTRLDLAEHLVGVFQTERTAYVARNHIETISQPNTDGFSKDLFVKIAEPISPALIDTFRTFVRALNGCIDDIFAAQGTRLATFIERAKSEVGLDCLAGVVAIQNLRDLYQSGGDPLTLEYSRAQIDPDVRVIYSGLPHLVNGAYLATVTPIDRNKGSVQVHLDLSTYVGIKHSGGDGAVHDAATFPADLVKKVQAILSLAEEVNQ